MDAKNRRYARLLIVCGLVVALTNCAGSGHRPPPRSDETSDPSVDTPESSRSQGGGREDAKTPAPTQPTGESIDAVAMSPAEPQAAGTPEIEPPPAGSGGATVRGERPVATGTQVPGSSTPTAETTGDVSRFASPSKLEKPAGKPTIAAAPSDAEPLPDAAEAAPQEEPEEAKPQDQPPHFEPVYSRWDIDPVPLFTPQYVVNRGKSPWDPYNLNQLKGDYPIIGQDVFLSMELESFTITEVRNTPLPSGITGNTMNNEDFFGDGDQTFITNITALEIDIFKGQQFFKPVDWRLKAVLAANVTYFDVNEVGVVNINPADGSDRLTADLSLQEAFLEVHLWDWNSRYDFVAVEAGILEFRSDFRGFIFDDIQLGVRLFGNADDNKWQYNLAFFNLLEKDTNSELNSFDDRGQRVFIANVYRFDWPFKGFNQEFSFHWSHDDGDLHFNVNDFLTRPAPIGGIAPHEIDTYYFGYAVDGHVGRLNINAAFYQVWGQDTEDPIAAREVEINAQLFAAELSYDWDWFRLKTYVFYASGDTNPRDGKANGFDAIVDSPNFAGGEFSYWNRQAIPLFGTFLTNRLSPLADLQATKFEGQAAFVNPGIIIWGIGADIELTPTVRMTTAIQGLRFSETSSLETFVELESIPQDLGTEVLLGIQYRPLLTNNIILTAGGSVLRPGRGLRKIYESDDYLWHLFAEVTLTW